MGLQRVRQDERLSLVFLSTNLYYPSVSPGFGSRGVLERIISNDSNGYCLYMVACIVY